MKKLLISFFAIVSILIPVSFANAETLSITSLSPSSGQIGDTVAINGENFKDINQIFFNGVETNIESITATKITVKVPSGATTGRVTIKTSVAKEGVNNIVIVKEYTGPTFRIISSDKVGIDSFLPVKGKAGDTITISGENFTGVDQILFNTTKAVSVTNSITEITVKVPVGATTGPITIKTTNYGNAVSSTNFTVSSDTDTTTTTTTTSTSTTSKEDKSTAASDASGLIPECPDSGCGFNEFMKLVNTVISFVLIDLATPLFALIIIYVGWLYLSAGGNSENVTKAKTILKNALIGYVIALVAWLIVKTILSTLGVTNTFLG